MIDTFRFMLRDTKAQVRIVDTMVTRAHTHRELIREWLWEPKGSSLEYVYVLGGESTPRP